MARMTEVPAVLAAIVAVNKAIAAGGIAKADKNAQQGFMFRGIDAVYEAVASPMAEHGLFSTSDVLSVERAERTSAKGGAIFVVYVTVQYTFWCATDGSSVSTTVVAEAMDSGDKATAKAMSVAHRTALLQLSTAPVNPAEPDAESYEVAPHVDLDPKLIGWDTKEDAVEAHSWLRSVIAEDLRPEQREALTAWREENGLTGWPLPRAEFDALKTHVVPLVDPKLLEGTEPFEHVPLSPVA